MVYLILGIVVGVLLTLGFYYWSVGRHKRIKSLTKFVVFSIAILIIYTIAEFTFAITRDTAHDTLTTCFYTCFGSEMLSCAVIKIFKLREDNHE